MSFEYYQTVFYKLTGTRLDGKVDGSPAFIGSVKDAIDYFDSIVQRSSHLYRQIRVAARATDSEMDAPYEPLATWPAATEEDRDSQES